MSDPYSLPETTKSRPSGPRVTLLTLVAVLFVGFMIVNVGLTIVDTQQELEQRRVNPGDRIEYHTSVYTLNGTLLSTTDLQVAQRAHQAQDFPLGPEGQYQSQRGTVDPANPGLGWGSEVDEAVTQSYIGQRVRVTTQPMGEWREFPPGGIPRQLGPETFQRYVFLQEPAAAAAEGNPEQGTPNFDLDGLERAIGPVETGTVYNADQVFPPTWDIVFEEVNRDNRSLLLHHTVQDGQFFDVEGLPGGVTILLEEDETVLYYRVDLEEGELFTVQQGNRLLEAGFQPGTYRVEEVSQDRVLLLHHEGLDPATIDEDVIVEIRILSRSP